MKERMKMEDKKVMYFYPVAGMTILGAIEKAIKMANKNDIIVLAGKGHEPYQEINGVKHPFDERIIVRDIISKMKSKK